MHKVSGYAVLGARSRSDLMPIAVGFNPRNPAGGNPASRSGACAPATGRPQASLTRRVVSATDIPWLETHGYRQGVAPRRHRTTRPAFRCPRNRLAAFGLHTALRVSA